MWPPTDYNNPMMGMNPALYNTMQNQQTQQRVNPTPPPAPAPTPIATPSTVSPFAKDNPYGFDYSQANPEKEAGVTPPQYYSMLDSNGQLKAPYSVDPTKSQAFSQMSKIAQDPNLSPWAALQMQQNDLATQHQRDTANANAQGQTTQALNQLEATGGGTGSGAATWLAMQGGKNATMANQNIGAQSQTNALGIQATDAQNKQNLLGQVANTETGALTANAGTAMNDTQNANIFSGNRYDQLMRAWGAKQTAAAQTAAANSGGGGKK